MSDRRPSRWRVVAAAFAAVGLATFFRLHQLDAIPRGLFIDEAQNGLDALSIRNGESLPVFVEAGQVKTRGREPMLHYLMAGMFALRGPSVTSIRLTVALIGIATVAVFFFLGQRFFGLRVAFLSTVLLAVSSWHVTMSRVGVRAILTPLWILLVCLALHRLVRRRTTGSALVFGVLVGAGFYTYPAFWVVPLALVAVSILLMLSRRVRWHGSDLRLVLVSLLGFCVVTAPLAQYAITKPDHFFARASELSEDLLASGERAAMFRDHLQRGLFMLHFRGDESPMYNLPGRPFLDPVTGIAFVAGLFLIVKELPRQPALHGALLCCWLLPLIPGASTSTGAWGMRSIGAIPAVFLIAGLGISRLTRNPIAWLPVPRWVSTVLLVAALAIISVLNYRGYFDDWANDPGVQGSYGTGIVRFFDFCSDLARENAVYVSPYVYNSPNFRFLTSERSPGLRPFDDAADLAVDSHDKRAARIFISDFAPLTDFIRRLYPGHEEIGRYSIWGRSGGFALRVPEEQLRAELSGAQRLEAGHWIRLMQAEFEAMTRSW